MLFLSLHVNALDSFTVLFTASGDFFYCQHALNMFEALLSFNVFFCIYLNQATQIRQPAKYPFKGFIVISFKCIHNFNPIIILYCTLIRLLLLFQNKNIKKCFTRLILDLIQYTVQVLFRYKTILKLLVQNFRSRKLVII